MDIIIIKINICKKKKKKKKIVKVLPADDDVTGP